VNNEEEYLRRKRLLENHEYKPARELNDWTVAFLGIGFWVILFISIALVVLARNAN